MGISSTEAIGVAEVDSFISGFENAVDLINLCGLVIGRCNF